MSHHSFLPASISRPPRLIRHSAMGGFTLIELLVVISIIALLIAILLPALGAARQSAISLKCLAQTKQHGLTVAMFANDNKGYMGPNLDERSVALGSAAPTAEQQRYDFWHYLYDPYLGATQITTQVSSPAWICPLQQGRLYSDIMPTSRAIATYFGSQYAVGSGRTTGTAGGFMYDGMTYRLDNLRQPSIKLFAAEKYTSTNGSDSSISKGRGTGSQLPYLFFEHPGSNMNVSFLDGHSAPIAKDDDRMSGNAGTSTTINAAAEPHHLLWNPGYPR